ncbi:radical SAM additional 4Fe4S-binding SPASM domain-containing protein [Caloranaerobacter azorensis DSM 13643]|uniref:Radical SAM additional 4Fe4S-binding SPASM domain-containing protein n=1 Tax=Caloranaerobacter azorensis DSM 13643 TaxID=1121264 RepID=A0A1M5RFK5_9FIRM|nr:radical SAM protein [Caloranaerobacter azorensis]SHH25162.1 radical SAM additional 4Fe4S-binding SPASM domain-containing protein [Caloranaerobacter azorensis DSM 13643]
MSIDPITCSEEELALFCFNRINLEKNNPDSDRKASNFSVEKLLAQQSKLKITLDSPLRILWKITGICNSDCVHCWASLGTEPTTSQLMSVAEQIGENNVLMVSLSGGEVFLRKDLFKVLKKLKSYNIIVEILTNGSLIDMETAKKLAKILNLETDVVQVSLDGSKASIHDKQRNSKIFGKAVQGIKNLRKCGIKVRIVFTATTINQYDIYNTYKLAVELDVQTFAPTPVFPLRRGKKFKNNLDSMGYIRQIAACKNIEDKVSTKLRIQVDQQYQFLMYKYFDLLDFGDIVLNQDRIVFPMETNATMQIDAAGEVIPGPEWETNLSAGNIYEEDLMSIWKKGKNWSEFRKGRNLIGTSCERCKVFPLCEGGNAKLAYEKYGTINMPDGSCLVNRRNLNV